MTEVKCETCGGKRQVPDRPNVNPRSAVWNWITCPDCAVPAPPLTADVQEAPDAVAAARHAIYCAVQIEMGTPLGMLLDAYAAAVRGEAEARIALLERALQAANDRLREMLAAPAARKDKE